MHELRKDPVTARWSVVLSGSLPPEAYARPSRPAADGPCSFCDEMKGASGAGVVARPSMAPVLTIEDGLERRGVGMYDMMNAFGVHEDIIESPEHGVPPEDIGPEHMKKVIEMQLERALSVSEDERVRYVLIGKNVGGLAGSTSSHPHSKITASPVMPFRVKEELDGARAYYEYKERCVYCDMLDEEARTGNARLVRESARFAVICPFSPMYPFEFWVLPRHHECDFLRSTPEEVADLSEVMCDVLGRMRHVLGEPSYGYTIHTAPARIPRRNQWHTLGSDYHWHIEVKPRLPVPGGYEWGSGFFLLTTSPEDAARYLREA